MLRTTILAIVALLATASVHAADWKDLEGSYVVSGEAYLDPDPKQPQNTHLFIQLHGQDAEDLWNALDVEPQPFDCDADLMAKNKGNVSCFHTPARKGDQERYECSFSVNLQKQTVEGGVAC